MLGLCLLYAGCGTTDNIATPKTVSKYTGREDYTEIVFVQKSSDEVSQSVMNMLRAEYEKESKLSQDNELFGSYGNEMIYTIQIFDRFGRTMTESPFLIHNLLAKYDNFDARVTSRAIAFTSFVSPLRAVFAVPRLCLQSTARTALPHEFRCRRRTNCSRKCARLRESAATRRQRLRVYQAAH